MMMMMEIDMKMIVCLSLLDNVLEFYAHMIRLNDQSSNE